MIHVSKKYRNIKNQMTFKTFVKVFYMVSIIFHETFLLYVMLLLKMFKLN